MTIFIVGGVGCSASYILIFLLLALQQLGNNLHEKIAHFIENNQTSIWVVILIISALAALILWLNYRKTFAALLSGVNVAHLGVSTIQGLFEVVRDGDGGFMFWFVALIFVGVYLIDVVVTGIVTMFGMEEDGFPLILSIATVVGWITAFIFW